METRTEIVGTTPIGSVYKTTKIDIFGLWAGEEYRVELVADYRVWKFCDGIYGMSYPCFKTHSRKAEA